MNLTDSEKQLILYSKNWFKRTDMIEDIRVIAARQYALDVEHTELYSIYNFITDLFLRLMDAGYIYLTHKQFMIEMFRKEKEINVEKVVKLMISEISLIKSYDLNLGDPDYTLLQQKGVETKWQYHNQN